jgi:hypothetical protein
MHLPLGEDEFPLEVKKSKRFINKSRNIKLVLKGCVKNIEEEFFKKNCLKKMTLLDLPFPLLYIFTFFPISSLPIPQNIYLLALPLSIFFLEWFSS